MARDFDGTSGYLTTATAPVTGTPLTISCWFRKTGTAVALKELVAVYNPTTSHEFAILAGNGSTACVTAFALGGPAYLANSSTTFSLDEWHHASGVFVAANERHAYLDGNGKGTNANSVAPTGLSRADIGHGLFTFFAGSVAEVAIWNVALADEEIALLAKGFSPLCLFHRLTNLVSYQDLIRPVDRPGLGPSYSIEGGTSVAPHPRIVYPWTSTLGMYRRRFLEFYRVSAAAAHANRALQGQSAVTGAEQGATFPIGEVAN